MNKGVNWRREIKDLRAEIGDLKNKILQMSAQLSTMEELLRLLAANQIMINLDTQLNAVDAEKEKLLRSVIDSIKFLQWKKQPFS